MIGTSSLAIVSSPTFYLLKVGVVVVNAKMESDSVPNIQKEEYDSDQINLY